LGRWREGVKAWVINYTYCLKNPWHEVEKDKLLTGTRIVDTHNSLKTYNLLSDLIKSILRENKLKEIGI